MGFKTKIFLLAIIAALAGYIYYFNVAWDTTTIIFTGAIVFMCLIDWNLDDPRKAGRSLKLKLFLFAILAALIFYIWYFDVPFSQDVITYTALTLATGILGFLMDKSFVYGAGIR